MENENWKQTLIKRLLTQKNILFKVLLLSETNFNITQAKVVIVIVQL